MVKFSIIRHRSTFLPAPFATALWTKVIGTVTPSAAFSNSSVHITRLNNWSILVHFFLHKYNKFIYGNKKEKRVDPWIMYEPLIERKKNYIDRYTY